MRPDAIRRSATLIGAAMSVVFALVVFAPAAGAAVEFSVVNGTVDGTSIHVIGSTNAFPNFATGAIDNRYPLAHAHVDGSPFSEGTASPADTGPLGATAAASAQKSQPQYADARYPPKANTKEFGDAPGPHARSSAADGTATAAATFAGTPPELETGATPAAEQASYRAFNEALTAWRAKFMTPVSASRYPFVAADPNEPDSFDGATSTGRATLDPARGLVLTTDARLARALLGGGAIRLLGLRATLEVVNGGAPKHTLDVEIVDASIGGVPVLVGPGGVVVNRKKLPDLIGPVEQASAALNQALAKAGFHVSELAPKVTRSASQETVVAAAAVVRWEQPPSGPGVPQQAIELRLGEAFADSLAMPGLKLGPPGGFLPSTEVAPPALSKISPPSAGTLPQVQRLPGGVPVAHVKPRWLLLAYLGWQSLMAGTVASLWLWRAQGRAA